MCTKLYARMGDKVENMLKDQDKIRALKMFMMNVVNWLVCVWSILLLECLAVLEDSTVTVYLLPASYTQGHACHLDSICPLCSYYSWKVTVRRGLYFSLFSLPLSAIMAGQYSVLASCH